MALDVLVPSPVVILEADELLDTPPVSSAVAVVLVPSPEVLLFVLVPPVVVVFPSRVVLLVDTFVDGVAWSHALATATFVRPGMDHAAIVTPARAPPLIRKSRRLSPEVPGSMMAPSLCGGIVLSAIVFAPIYVAAPGAAIAPD